MEEPNDAPPDAEMGPLRKAILIIGFNMVFFLGFAATWKFQSPLIQWAFIVCSIVFFAWLARWTRWK